MICKRCMVIMTTGTRYEKNGRSLYKRYFECQKCHDRIYTKAPNFQEILAGTLKNRIR